MKSKKFFEIWGNLEYTITNYQRIIVFLSILLILETCAIFSLSRRKQAVIVVPGAVKKMTLVPGELSEDVVKNFGHYIASLYLSFQPGNFKIQTSELLKYVHPSAYGELQKEFISQNEKIIKTSYSQVFYPVSEYVEKQKEGYIYRIRGILKKYIGDKKVGEEENEYEFILKKIPPSESNPYGLAIESITTTTF